MSSHEQADSRDDAGSADERTGLGHRLLDVVLYALVVDVLTFSVAAAIGAVIGGFWLLIELVMFVAGILLFGYATLLLRPDTPWETTETADGELTVVQEDKKTASSKARRDSKIQAVVERLPVVSEKLPEPADQYPVSGKLFVASLVVLLTSFLIERLVVMRVWI